jgi:hypothetical protein
VLKHKTFSRCVSTNAAAGVLTDNTLLLAARSPRFPHSDCSIPQRLGHCLCSLSPRYASDCRFTAIRPLSLHSRSSVVYTGCSSVLPPSTLARVTSLTKIFDSCDWWDHERGSSFWESSPNAQWSNFNPLRTKRCCT